MIFSIRKIITVLWAVWLVLTLFHFTFGLDFQPSSWSEPSAGERLTERFLLTAEGNIPTLFSTVLFLAAAGLLYAVSQSSVAFRKHWKGLSWIFFFLAIDETGCFHEILSIQMRLAVETHGILYYPWTGPAVLLVAVLTGIYLRFFLALEWRIQIFFLIAAFLFLGGTLGLEFYQGMLIDQGTERSIQQAFLLASIEEAVELAGQIVFIHGLLDLLKRTHPQGEIRIV
ncbi:MAG: hypothetical protein ACLFPX_04480 [Candidatus Omnitrophota bacterium]